MEKNQHNQKSETTTAEQAAAYTGSQPGQQLPTGKAKDHEPETSSADNKAKHSESSFPQQEDETLGTP